MGRTAVASGPDDAIRNGLDEGTGKEAEGFLTIVLPDLGGREVRGTKNEYMHCPAAAPHCIYFQQLARSGTRGPSQRYIYANFEGVLLHGGR